MWYVIFIIVGIHVVHGITLDRKMEYVEREFSSKYVPKTLHDYRIAFLTDIHDTSDKALSSVIETINRSQIDALFLGGDFSMNQNRMKQQLAIISQAKVKDGIFGVDGNHDTHAKLFEAKEAYGMTVLENKGIYVRGNLFVAGVEDYWREGEDTIARAVRHAKEEDFVVLLAHNPDVTMGEDTKGIDLVLSGHTHGGQATFFGLFC